MRFTFLTIVSLLDFSHKERDVFNLKWNSRNSSRHPNIHCFIFDSIIPIDFRFFRCMVYRMILVYFSCSHSVIPLIRDKLETFGLGRCSFIDKRFIDSLLVADIGAG